MFRSLIWFKGGGTHGLMAIFEMAVILKIFTRVMTNYISVESL
jgi:hypothetical protein